MTTRTSSSGLAFHIHPLVLINISDHSTRVHTNSSAGPARTRVLGCLLGQQTSRVVDIINSLEIRYEDGPEGIVIDEGYLAKKQEQYKQVFPKLDTVGWYSTGSGIEQYDMQIHKLIMNFNESPVFLLLDDNMGMKHKNLPVNLYESELHILDCHPQSVFVEAKYKIETSEAERIGINQIAKVLPRGNDRSSDQLAAQYASLHAAIKMLHSRVALLIHLLSGMQKGEVPYEHSIVRQAATLVRQLPAIRAAPFHKTFLMDLSDTTLCVLMSSITKGCDLLNDVVDKVNTAYDRTASRRRGGMV